MKTNIIIDISLPYLAKFWVSAYGPKCCQPINLQHSLNCNILRKKWMMKFVFYMQINIEVFKKVMLSLWLSLTRHAQSTQISSISLQYLHKSKGYEVDFLHVDKHKRFLQDDMVCIARNAQSTQNNRLIFYLLINVKGFFKEILSF